MLRNNLSDNISIIVVCFKNPMELRATLSSILNAGSSFIVNRSIEIIVVDGSADQDITDVVNDFSTDELFLKLISEPDRGIYDAMNKGLRLARGQHIIYMNSGDCFHPGGLQQFLSQPRDPEVLYYGDAEFYHSGQRAFSFKSNMQQSRCFLQHNCFSHQAIFYPTALLRSLAGYRLDYPISADFDLTWRCWRSGCRFEHLDAVIADCELGGISCQRGLQSYKDRIASFQDSGANVYALLLWLYFPVFYVKNRIVNLLEGSRLLDVYRKYKVR
jgi:putative colanic acid biosynthesis glycosyltransferase